MKNQALPTCENFTKRYNNILDLKKRLKYTLRPIEQELLKEEINELLLGVFECVQGDIATHDCEVCKSLIESELKFIQTGKIVKLPG